MITKGNGKFWKKKLKELFDEVKMNSIKRPEWCCIKESGSSHRFRRTGIIGHGANIITETNL